MVEDFFGDKFFCWTFGLYSAPNKHKGQFLRMFSKILWGGWGRERLKTFLFYNTIEKLFVQTIVFMRNLSIRVLDF